jgi:PEP-CTERM motif
MRQLLRLAAITLVLLLATTPAHAGMLLALDFQGVTWVDSSIGGTPIDFGTSYTIQADFDPTTATILGQGVASYAVTSIAVTVGGTSYSVTDLSDFSIFLIDATNPYYPGLYNPSLSNNSDSTGFDPAYTMATPASSATDPTPTVFSGYDAEGPVGNIVDFSTGAGPLTLTFDIYSGIDTSINSVPEPSSLVLSGIGGAIGLVVAWRRRKRAA